MDNQIDLNVHPNAVEYGRKVRELMDELFDIIPLTPIDFISDYRYYLPLMAMNYLQQYYCKHEGKKFESESGFESELVFNSIKILPGYENKIILAHMEHAGNEENVNYPKDTRELPEF